MKKTVNIAVLSGKGGTGKTTMSINLAIALNANYVDCDVEEPNGFLFLKPTVYKNEDVMVEYPEIKKDKCISCGICTQTCKFNALAKVKDNIMVFDKLCHSCGACKISCKTDAIVYKNRVIGKLESGKTRNIECIRGILNVGEPMAVPVIKQLLKSLPKGINLIDCPPGTSCNVVNSLKYADIAILVTEPSEFGLHDLKLAVELVKIYNIPFCVVINKDDGKENIVKKYCEEENIKIIGYLPYSRDTVTLYSKGQILYDDVNHKLWFDEISTNIKEVLLWN
nr:ATP-binding protein [Clostridium chauvoei]